MDGIKVDIRKIAITFSILIMAATIVFAEQPGTYDSRDWNAGEFEPGAGMRSTEDTGFTASGVGVSIKVDSEDWESGKADPGGRAGSTEGMRVVPYRVTRSIKAGREMLKKKAAREYIGNIKQKLLSGNYTGEILLRTKPDPKYNTLSDGIIFNTGGGRNYYITRKEGEHVIMLDVPGGRQEVTLTKANFHKFENAIHDDNDTPYVLFDRDGNEAAIVFVEWHTRVKQQFNKTGEVIISLKGAPAARHRYR